MCSNRTKRLTVSLIPMLLFSGCAADTGPSEVRISLRAAVDGPRPDYLRLNWMSDGGMRIRNQRVPEKGTLQWTQHLMEGTINVGIDEDSFGERRIVLSGYAEETDELLADAAARVDVQGGKLNLLFLELGAEPLPDQDGDGIPDGADDCPDIADPDQTCGGGGD